MKYEVLKSLIDILILIFKTAILVFLYWAVFMLLFGRFMPGEGLFIIAALSALSVNPPDRG